MMKRGKDEEKTMGPMFPRLHVNDTDKGGPRAPPRNKMALYEQLSIPSQRFSHGGGGRSANNNAVPHSTQRGGNGRGAFFSHQMSSIHNEKQFSRYTDLNTPLDQVEQRKNVDEDDYTVPIFIHPVPSQEHPKYNNGTGMEKLSASKPSSFNHPLKVQQNNDKDLQGRGIRQKPTDRQSSVALEENVRVNKRNFSSLRALAEDHNIVDELSTDSESREDDSCRSPEMANLERNDSVSETSILDSVSRPEMTPDDVVGLIGQKHFWKARRAIANQQRVFAVQVFELHRLIKVQKLVAASPHLLLENSTYLDKPIEPPSPRKKLQLDDTLKSVQNISKQNFEPEKTNNKNEEFAENTPDKTSPPFDQNPGVSSPVINPPPTPSNGNDPTPSNGNDHNVAPWCFNQPQGHHWLIPVMTPSEGLVYKPYPVPGFTGPPYGGCGPLSGQGPVMGNFVIPGFGAPPPPQYQLPSYPSPVPHSYFPHYSMPMMNTSAFSGSSVEQINTEAVPGHFSAGETRFSLPNQKNGHVPNLALHGPEDIEVQASTGSSRAADERSMLPLFPTSPVKDSHNTAPLIDGPNRPSPTRVIRVVPHNARIASESAARIFLSIQEERKQNDSA